MNVEKMYDELQGEICNLKRRIADGGNGGVVFDELNNTEYSANNVEIPLSQSIDDYDFLYLQFYYYGGSGNPWLGTSIIQTAILAEDDHPSYNRSFWISGGNADRGVQFMVVNDTTLKITAIPTATIVRGIYGIKI